MSERNLKSHKTTWTRALFTFLAPLALIFGFRWALYEPYVIPSGSMIPTLFIHDHILVNKWVYGLRVPWTNHWLWNWKQPELGDVVVFRYPMDQNTFFVKRIVALEGDTIEVREGQLILNGKPVARLSKPEFSLSKKEEATYDYFQEQLGSHSFVSRSLRSQEDLGRNYSAKVPQGHFFVVGDNRDESHDSRAWGFVPMNLLIGRVGIIWLSCDHTLSAAPFICDPAAIRGSRLLKTVE